MNESTAAPDLDSVSPFPEQHLGRQHPGCVIVRAFDGLEPKDTTVSVAEQKMAGHGGRRRAARLVVVLDRGALSKSSVARSSMLLVKLVGHGRPQRLQRIKGPNPGYANIVMKLEARLAASPIGDKPRLQPICLDAQTLGDLAQLEVRHGASLLAEAAPIVGAEAAAMNAGRIR